MARPSLPPQPPFPHSLAPGQLRSPPDSTQNITALLPSSRTMARDSNCNWHTSLVFSFTRPTADAIEELLAAAVHFPASLSCFLTLQLGLKIPRLPAGFAHDSSRTRIGQGER